MWSTLKSRFDKKPKRKPSYSKSTASRSVTMSTAENEQVVPDRASRCTWKRPQEKNPHVSRAYKKQTPDLLPNILHAIGDTPLVKLNRIPQTEGIECDIYVKCEFLNPGGSIKDRIALRMLEAAEAAGRATPGRTTIIEPTSGNTGIGVALACAVKGYACVIVMPDNMSAEKNDTLLALGARVIRTPADAEHTSGESHYGVAARLHREIGDSVVLNQYANANNPLAHYEETGEEIMRQCAGQVDMIVCGAGTGGTAAGIGRMLKEKHPECVLVAVEPETIHAAATNAAAAAAGETATATAAPISEIEGIGYHFVPTVFDRSVVDRWGHCTDRSTFQMARRLIVEEGILAGGSSGATLTGALEAARDLRKGQRCVVILADGIRNYMSKFVSDNWMEARKYQPIVEDVAAQKLWWTRPLAELLEQQHSVQRNAVVVSVPAGATCAEALRVMREQRVERANVLQADRLLGVVTLAELTRKAVNGDLRWEDCVAGAAMVNDFRRVAPGDACGLVARILEKHEFVVVDDAYDNVWRHVTRGDLLQFVAAGDATRSEK